MASLLFTAVGSLVGGPIGGAIGAVLGQQIDQRLLAPKPRRGPRLNEFAVQTSHYGQPLPVIFGTARVSGTVIWATDLRETSARVSNGKGRPRSTVYAYSASFAVALSARRVLRVGRIWADGKLLRGAEGDFKSPVTFRLHDGSERQAPDPLIASAQGIANCPAYRGTAYAVFEDMALGDYGNRIPSLSFEVVADDHPVPLGTIVEALSGGVVDATLPDAVTGLHASGASLRTLLDPWQPLLAPYLVDDGVRLRAGTAPAALASISPRDLGAGAGTNGQAVSLRTRRSGHRRPRALTASHYEPARDFQPGLQRVYAGGAGPDERLELPTALPGTMLKALLSRAAARLGAAELSATITLPWHAMALRPGDQLVLPGRSEAWQVRSVTIERLVVAAEIVRLAADVAPAEAADVGAPVREVDAPPGETRLVLLDLPPLDAVPPAAPVIVLAAAGSSPGWRRAAVLASRDGGVTWQEEGSTARPAILGTALNTLGPGPWTIEDRQSSVEVMLVHAAMTLQDADEAALAGGANLAMLGAELFQFGRATLVAPGRYRLMLLRRGLRGSEWAINAHRTGDDFVLVERDSLLPIEVAQGPGAIQLLVSGAGDLVPATALRSITGEALRPPAPVRLRADPAGDGLALRWIRRSRSGWSWPDSVDAPLGEAREQYRVSVVPNAGPASAFEVPVAELILDGPFLAAARAAGAATLDIAVHQIGDLAQSRPAQIAVPI